MSKATIRDIDLDGKRVLVRADFNVPVDKESGAITDDSRIRAVLPTIRYLIEHEARVILCSHMGRPKGKVVDELRLTIIAYRLSELLGQPVRLTSDCIGSETEAAVNGMKAGEVLLLENLRFHPEEEKNEAGFARSLASLADVFVNDAFGTSHRAHASVVGVTRYLPSVAGFLLKKEIETLSGILDNPVRPFAALLGGAKVSDKVGVIENIMGKVDHILIGGGMAATFLKVKSYETGLSLIETDTISVAAELMKDAAQRGVNLQLPIDVIVTGELNPDAVGEAVPVAKIPSDKRVVDMGPETIDAFREVLLKCKTVFWNGPMGIYEMPQFADGTKAMADTLSGLDATAVIGGGSTADVIADMGLKDKVTFVSTGGGASLEFLSGKVLPGIEALTDKEM